MRTQEAHTQRAMMRESFISCAQRVEGWSQSDCVQKEAREKIPDSWSACAYQRAKQEASWELRVESRMRERICKLADNWWWTFFAVLYHCARVYCFKSQAVRARMRSSSSKKRTPTVWWSTLNRTHRDWMEKRKVTREANEIKSANCIMFNGKPIELAQKHLTKLAQPWRLLPPVSLAT